MTTTEEWEFDAAAAVHLEAPGLRRADLATGWDMGGVPNGGYLMSVAARALLAEAARPDPLTLTCHYLAPARMGPIEIATEILRAGRRHTTGTAIVRQDGSEIARVMGTLADLSAAPASTRHYSAVTPPEIPPPDDCVLIQPMPDNPVGPPPLTEKVELRMRPEDVGFAFEQPHGRAEMIGWAAFADGRPPDTSSLPLFADAFPPTVFNAGFPVGWMPTIEMTVHVRKRPAPGHLLCDFRTNLVSSGYMEVDGILFDATGEVVAMSRQLASVPRGRT